MSQSILINRENYQKQKVILNEKKQTLITYLRQAKRTNNILNFNLRITKMNFFKKNAATNLHINVNKFKKRKIELDRKIKQVHNNEKEEKFEFTNNFNKLTFDIKNLKIKRLFYQKKLQFFYLESLTFLNDPSTKNLTAPLIIKKLSDVKGKNTFN